MYGSFHKRYSLVVRLSWYGHPCSLLTPAPLGPLARLLRAPLSLSLLGVHHLAACPDGCFFGWWSVSWLGWPTTKAMYRMRVMGWVRNRKRERHRSKCKLGVEKSIGRLEGCGKVQNLVSSFEHPASSTIIFYRSRGRETGLYN